MSESLRYLKAKPPSPDTLRVLIATDNHLGFLVTDPVRGEDSFDTMDEILQTARDCHCDCVFLSGDLFHHNKPSRRTMFLTQQVFKKHVFGDAPVSIQVTSDQQANFGGRIVNYEDPSLSVQLPVFIIHGNHDDPTREAHTEALSAIDILAEAGLVNYFGRTDKTDDIKIKPVLIEKGPVGLALYGLGWIRDERLHRAFTDKKVVFSKVDEQASGKNWFNVMLIHQNRAEKGRGEKNCVAESMIPGFMDFVIWGHEHECQITPVPHGSFHLVQPGSSVAVSLVESESIPKHIGVLEVKLDSKQLPTSRLVPVPLQSVRPFILDTSIELAEEPLLQGEMAEIDKQDAVFQFLTQRVLDLLNNHAANLEREGADLDTSSALYKRKAVPLVRLKVEHTGFPTINQQRFGAQFVEKVANPGEILLFWRKKKLPISGPKKPNTGDAMDDVLDDLDGIEVVEDTVNDSPQDRIQRLAEQILKETAQHLELFTDQKLHLAVEEFVVKETTSAIMDVVTDTVESMQKQLRRERTQASAGLGVLNEQVISDAVTAVVERERKKEEAERRKAEPRQELEALRRQIQTRTAEAKELQTDDESDGETPAPLPAPKARQTQAAVAPARKAQEKVSDVKRQRRVADEEDELEESPVVKKTAKSKASTTANSRPAAVAKTVTKTTARPQNVVSRRKVESDSDEDADPSTFLSQAKYSNATAPQKRGR